MKDQDTTNTTPPAKKSTKAATKAAAGPAPSTARIRILKNGAKACGFTFAKGHVVPKVPFVHASFLEEKGEAEILEVQ